MNRRRLFFMAFGTDGAGFYPLSLYNLDEGDESVFEDGNKGKKKQKISRSSLC